MVQNGALGLGDLVPSRSFLHLRAVQNNSYDYNSGGITCFVITGQAELQYWDHIFAQAQFYANGAEENPLVQQNEIKHIKFEDDLEGDTAEATKNISRQNAPPPKITAEDLNFEEKNVHPSGEERQVFTGKKRHRDNKSTFLEGKSDVRQEPKQKKRSRTRK